MSIIETSTDTLLQKLIDDAFDEVCAEYDKFGSLQTCAGDSGPLPTILGEANSALKEIGSGTLIIHGFEQAHELVFILARCGGHTARCCLLLDSKTGVADNDLVLINEFEFAPFSYGLGLGCPPNGQGLLSLSKFLMWQSCWQ
jgi:hypothetical protein